MTVKSPLVPIRLVNPPSASLSRLFPLVGARATTADGWVWIGGDGASKRTVAYFETG